MLSGYLIDSVGDINKVAKQRSLIQHVYYYTSKTPYICY